MDSTRRTRLEQIMRSASAADPAYSATCLVLEFQGELRRVLDRLARHQGARLPADELHGLVVDAAFELVAMAGSWRPGGAAPWVWAEHRLRRLVAAHIGQHHQPLEALAHEPVAPSMLGPGPVGGSGRVDADRHPAEALDVLRHRHPELAAVGRLLDRAGTDAGDRHLLLRYHAQQNQGDPSPSHTVGTELGITPDAVRQRVRRARRRLAASVERLAHHPDMAGLRGRTVLGVAVPGEPHRSPTASPALVGRSA